MRLVMLLLYLINCMHQFLQELQIILSALRDWIIMLTLATLFFFTCNVGTVTMFGHTGPFFVFTQDSFAALWFQYLVAHVVPSSVPIIVTGPLTAFAVQIKLSLLLAFIVTLPLLLYKIFSYISPALYEREQRILYGLTAPIAILFAGGVYFAYTYIVPVTFFVLYGYAVPLGATTFLAMNEFIGLTIALLLVGGVFFTLPVLMTLLTFVGVVARDFWWQKWRQAFITLLVVSAIITPDGSGVSMVLLSIPTTSLYLVGAMLSMRIGSTQKDISPEFNY